MNPLVPAAAFTSLMLVLMGRRLLRRPPVTRPPATPEAEP